MGMRLTEDPNSEADERIEQEGGDHGELTQHLDGKQASDHSRDQSRDDRTDDGGACLWVNAAERLRDETVLAHRVENAGLSEQLNEHNAGEGG